MMSFKLLLICFVAWFSLFFMVGVPFFPFLPCLLFRCCYVVISEIFITFSIYWAFSHFFAHCLKSYIGHSLISLGTCEDNGLHSSSSFCLLFSVLCSLCASYFDFSFFTSVFSLLWCRVLASIMIESSCCCFWTCNRNSMQANGYTGLAYDRELMKSVGQLL